jgi:transcription antitermination factor NusG
MISNNKQTNHYPIIKHMQRNWYLICTAKNQEINVTARLSKKGIESFCPTTSIVSKTASRTARSVRPLFTSYVFVCITDAELKTVKHTAAVINQVYYKSSPVVVSQDEINAIKIMCDTYSCIQIEKTAISLDEKVNIVKDLTTTYNSKSVSVIQNGLSVILPTLGFKMIAQSANNNFPATQKKESFFSASFAKKLTPAFLFNF